MHRNNASAVQKQCECSAEWENNTDMQHQARHTSALFIHSDMSSDVVYHHPESASGITGQAGITGHAPSENELISNTGTQSC